MSPLGANATYFNQSFYIPSPTRQEQGLTDWNYQSDFSNEARAALDDQISSLKRDYGFVNGDVVTDFLVRHRTIRTVLKDAAPQLRKTFGVDNIFNLEVSKDEDGSETIYAIAIWREDVWHAAEALHHFLENWWLQRMNTATSDLAFIYKLI